MALGLGILLAVAAMVSWGVADFLAKKAIDQVGYKICIVLNQLIAFVPILLIAIILFKAPTFSLTLIGITIAAGVSGVMGYVFFYRGLGKGDVSLVAPISASWSVVTVLLAFLLLGETLGPMQLVGVIIVFVGVFLTSTNLSELRKAVKRQRWSAGTLDGVIAMIAWGVSYVLLKPIVSTIGPIAALLFLKILAVATLLSWTGVTKTKISLPKRMVLFLIAVAGLLDFSAYLAFNFSLNTQFVSISSAIVATAPAITLTLAYVFLKERIVSNQKLGIIAILFGLVLISLT